MIPHMLNDDPMDVVTDIRALAASHIDKEIKLKEIIFNLPYIDKYPFSTLNGEEFLRYVFACLSYSMVNIEIVNIPPFRAQLNSNVSLVLSELSLQGHPIVSFSDTAEQALYAVLEL
jgi:hypothetical protein